MSKKFDILSTDDFESIKQSLINKMSIYFNTLVFLLGSVVY